MLHQVFQSLITEWSRAGAMRVLLEIGPVLLPAVIWAVVPPLRKRGHSLLVLFSLFTAIHALFTAYTLIFDWEATARRLSWPGGPFALKLGFFHAACAAGLAVCLAAGRSEWTRSLLITLSLYAASSTALHLFEAFAHDRVAAAHLGPPVLHDLLFVFLAFWVLRRARDSGRPVYYVPG